MNESAVKSINIEPCFEDIEKTAEVLAHLQPGKLPLKIFIEIARLTVTPIVEVVPVRMDSNGNIQVLLTEREASDPVWGGMLHTPGTVVRVSDREGTNADAFERILEGELGGVSVGEPVFVENVFHEVRRGMEQAQVHYVEVFEEPVNGQFYDAGNLPENTVDSQLDFISHVVATFASNSNS